MTNFIFIQPIWLLGSFACLYALYAINHQHSDKSSWWQLMDKNIAESLITQSGSHRLLSPLNLLLILIALICLALAGPSNSKQVPEELENKASVIVVLSNNSSMYSGDITPNRNRVAKAKINELIASMPDSQFGLITYAKTAHQVSPLTADPKFLSLYLNPLEPDLMPTHDFETTGLQDALPLISKMAKHAKYPVNVVIMADKLTPLESQNIIEFQSSQDLAVNVLAIGTRQGGALRFASNATVNQAPDTTMVLAPFETLKANGVAMTGVTQTQDDIDWLVSSIERAVKMVTDNNDLFPWHHAGYLLAVGFLPICLLLFRKNTFVFQFAPVFLISVFAFSPNTYASESQDLWQKSVKVSWQALWYTPDQLGQKALAHGDFKTASEQFESPYLKGWSYYQLADYPNAETQFRLVETAQGLFYLANSLAMQEKYKEALMYYGKALELAPNFIPAKNNAEKVKQALAQSNKVTGNKREVNDEGQIMLQVGAKGKTKKRKKLHPDPKIYSEEELNLWLDKVTSSPDKLLKTKFELQSQEKMIDAL